MFDYVNSSTIKYWTQLVSERLAEYARLIEPNQQDACSLAAIWREFLLDFLREVENIAESHVRNALSQTERWSQHCGNNPRIFEALEVFHSLRLAARNKRIPCIT